MTWQPAALRYPDAEAVICDALRMLLSGVHVDRRRPPKSSLKRFVVVNRDGGAIGEMRDRPRLRIRVWAEDDEQVHDLASDVVASMPLLVGATTLRVEHLSGPIEIPEDGPLVQRYLLYEVHLRPLAQTA